jgi:hypothetical protein
VNHKLWLYLGIALLCTTFSARAQTRQEFNVKCESDDGHLRRCNAAGAQRVTLVRQISGSACIEGRTWGYDKDTVWVDAGCRAEFRVQTGGYLGGNNQPGYGGSGQYGSGQTIRCSSDDGRRHVCRADTGRGVKLVQQVSGSRCIEGQTWGYTRDGIWVDRGCRADFQVGAYGNSGGYFPGQGGYGNASTIHCASDDERRHLCRVDTRGGVRLSRQVSGSKCIQGQTWGYTNDAIWVDRGCRADFQVGGYRQGSGNWPGQGNQQSSNTVYCASDDGGRHYCATNTGNMRRVRMVRQRSGSPCVEGQTWGSDERGIWVDRGCRAEFSIGGGERHQERGSDRQRGGDQDRDYDYDRD